MQILQRRLVVNLAKEHNCEAILWGDSTTRLAERTLAETAKGRGFSLPWIVADGDSPHRTQFYYPMRDLLSKEIEAFASLVAPQLDDLILAEEKKPAVSTKNTTIDELMKQYFESVERDYPSIVANVVKTAGKLELVPLSGIDKQCELCEMPLLGNAPEKSRLCYGCVRTLPQAAG
jgi:cytoplasmic tRNA 2-thiolation protein 2